jgi:hypothetical protein
MALSSAGTALNKEWPLKSAALFPDVAGWEEGVEKVCRWPDRHQSDRPFRSASFQARNSIKARPLLGRFLIYLGAVGNV